MNIIDVFLVSISPLGAGIGVPVGIVSNIDPVTVIAVASIGNLLPTFLFYRITDAIRKFKHVSWYLDRAHEETERYREKYGSIGIILSTLIFGGHFAGISAALIGISLQRAIPALFMGLLLQSVIIAWLTCIGIDAWECFGGYLQI
ncbi:MAG TPA: hypothetical protein EYP67_00505 [Methanosarcinales archaeon]|nr:hypothetical protein [Methanosarcinales archaeon]